MTRPSKATIAATKSAACAGLHSLRRARSTKPPRKKRPASKSNGRGRTQQAHQAQAVATKEQTAAVEFWRPFGATLVRRFVVSPFAAFLWLQKLRDDFNAANGKAQEVMKS